MDKEKVKDLGLFLLRIVAAYIFITNGAAKLFHMPHIVAFDGLQWFSLLGVAGILEFFGGILILIGYFTRPVAFLLAGEMAVAYFIGHAVPQGHAFLPLLNEGQPAVLLCFIFLFFAVNGAGAWSVDRIWRSKE